LKDEDKLAKAVKQIMFQAVSGAGKTEIDAKILNK
jgi:hypothetical protein